MKTKSRHKNFAAYLHAQPRERTQDAIGKALGLSASMVSRLKRHRCGVSGPVALRVSKLTGIPVEALLIGPAHGGR